jgi:site-specific DNA recombinase
MESPAPQRYKKRHTQRRVETKAKTSTTARRAIGYVRISVERDGKLSPEIQRDAIKAYCKSKGYELIDTESDIGRSAAEGKARPAFDRVMTRIASGEADVLVVYKLDRMTRSVVDFARIWSQLAEHGVDFASTEETFDTTTTMGRGMLQIAVVFAQIERETIQERTKNTARWRREQQMIPGGVTPYGYRKIVNSDGTRFEIEPKQAEIVREVAQRVIAGESLRSICLWLKTSEAPLPRTAAVWRYATLRKIVTKPTIAGLRDDPGTDELVAGGWPAILDVDTWTRVGDALADPARRNASVGREPTLLSGLIACGRCGAALRPKRTSVGLRYRCVSAPGEHDACGGPSILAADAEPFVLDELWATLEGLDAARVEPITISDDVESERAGLEAELDELARLYETRQLSLAEYVAFRDATRARLGVVTSVLDVERRESTIVRLVSDGAHVRDVWDELPIDTRRAVIREAFETITLRDNGVQGKRLPAVERLTIVRAS